MADLGAIDFSLIEPHKENIIPLSTGRSARALVTALTSSHDEHQAERQSFENELVTASDLDDPLDVWTRYVTWTLNTYPSGNSSESQLLPLLERATRAFLHDSHYKNDPRYVKFWILYIQKFSDAPREHFTYLATNDIGQRLALFYEEFATWLESVGRRGQAREVYQMGVENGARPRERLVRKFEEFTRRCEANPITGDEPRSPALPAVRPALAAKTLPFGGIGDPGYPDPQSQTSHPTAPRQKREKMAIFSDADNGLQEAPVLGSGTGGWDSIGTLEHRRKENIMEPTPWAGQTLKQQGGGGKAFAGEKLAIFRDTSHHPPAPIAQFAAAASGAPSFPNAQYIYPDPTKPSLEYSFEELRAIQRNLVKIDWGLRRREAEAKRKFVTNKPNRRPLTPEIDFSLPSPRVQTISTKLHSPSPGKGKLKKRSQMINKAEPTMTLHTRAATDEVYDILSQPIDHPSKDLDAEGDGNDEESDFFDDDLTTNTDVGGRGGSDSSDSNENYDGSGVGSGEEDVGSDWDDKGLDYVDETMGLSNDTIFQKVKKAVEEDDQESDEHHYSEDEEPGLPPSLPNMQPRRLFGDENHSGGGRKKPFMTPIAERTEVSLPPTTARRRAAERAQVAKTPSRSRGARAGDGRELEAILSSPLQDVVDGNGDANSGSGEESDFFQAPPPRKLDLIGGAALKREGNLKSPPPVTTKKKANSPTSGNINGDNENELLGVGKRSALALGMKKPLASSPTTAFPKTDIAHKGGPLITDTQINPMTPEMHSNIVSKLDPPLSVYDGYYEYSVTTKSRAPEIRKSLKPPSAKAAGAGGDKSVEVTFPGKSGVKGRPAQGQTKYIFQKQIAEGAFAPVYLVENTDVAGAAREDDDEDLETFKDLALVSEVKNLRRKPVEAVKMQTDPPSSWEFYIMRQAHRRLGVSRASESILHALECHVFPKEASFLVLPFQSQGTVLDLVNLSNKELGTAKPQAGMDETLTMFLAVELLRTVEALHSKGIIHGDLKPDNCLVRFEDVSDAEWESRYKRDGSGGWSKKGIVLIDFGRGIDMKIFAPNVQFVADWNPDPITDCVEIRTMRPWTYQIDYHGCAGIIHSMLFGRYLETIGEKGGGVGGALLGGGVVGTGGGTTWKVRESFKRYWQGEIWTRCFDVLLNPGKYVGEEEGGKLPVTKAVRRVREEMEKWLEGNSEKGVGLRNTIRKLEAGVNRGRR